MKNKFLLLVSLAALSATIVGCINTVSGNKTPGVPFMNDQVAARYERSLDDVFNASKNVLMRNGTISSAGTLFNQTNDVRVIEGMVKQEKVYIRLEAVEPKLTELTIQTRTSATTDLSLAHELDKETALELSH